MDNQYMLWVHTCMCSESFYTSSLLFFSLWVRSDCCMIEVPWFAIKNIMCITSEYSLNSFRIYSNAILNQRVLFEPSVALFTRPRDTILWGTATGTDPAKAPLTGFTSFLPHHYPGSPPPPAFTIYTKVQSYFQLFVIFHCKVLYQFAVFNFLPFHGLQMRLLCIVYMWITTSRSSKQGCQDMELPPPPFTDTGHMTQQLTQLTHPTTPKLRESHLKARHFIWGTNQLSWSPIYSNQLI